MYINTGLIQNKSFEVRKNNYSLLARFCSFQSFIYSIYVR